MYNTKKEMLFRAQETTAPSYLYNANLNTSSNHQEEKTEQTFYEVSREVTEA